MGQGNTDTLARTASSVTSNYDNTPLGLSGEQAGSGSTAYDRTPKGGIVGSRLSDGTDEYYVLDSLGSVVGIFDGTGVYHGGYAYDPYGRARNTDTDTLVMNNNIRYIGGYYDQTTTTTSNSALYRLGARYYDPTIGRFTQYDPTGQEANAFAYGKCNAVNSKDPSGAGSFLGVVGCVGLTALGLGVTVGALATITADAGAAVFGAPETGGLSLALGAALAVDAAALLATGVFITLKGVTTCIGEAS